MELKMFCLWLHTPYFYPNQGRGGEINLHYSA
jgi:hypothetical protein